MFKQEINGYSKSEVDNYLHLTLEKLEFFEAIIVKQKKEIESLEKRLATNGSSDDIVEKAKENADKILFDALIKVKGLQEKISEVVENELLK